MEKGPVTVRVIVDRSLFSRNIRKSICSLIILEKLSLWNTLFILFSFPVQVQCCRLSVGYGVYISMDARDQQNSTYHTCLWHGRFGKYTVSLCLGIVWVSTHRFYDRRLLIQKGVFHIYKMTIFVCVWTFWVLWMVIANSSYCFELWYYASMLYDFV